MGWVSTEGSIVAIIVQADIENVFGTRNVAMWSNLDNDSETANTSRITVAIATAEDAISDRLRSSRYIVPLTPNGSHSYTVKHWAAVLAGHWLYSSRVRGDETSSVAAQHAQVMAEMDAVAAGGRGIDYATKERAGTAPWVA